MKNLQYLATEIYKVKNCLYHEIMKDVFIFQENQNDNVRSGTHLAIEIYIQRILELTL